MKAVVLASIAGTWLHTTLDAFTHSGMQPFYPLPGNPFYALIGDFTIAEGVILYGFCTLAFLISIGMIGISAAWKRWKTTVCSGSERRSASVAQRREMGGMADGLVGNVGRSINKYHHRHIRFST